MRKRSGSKKTGISISIDEVLLKQLDAFCQENFNAERSAVVEKALLQFLEQKKMAEQPRKKK